MTTPTEPSPYDIPLSADYTDHTTPPLIGDDGPPTITEAPYGYTLDGRPKKSPAGRKPRSDHSAPKPRAPRPPRAEAPKRATTTNRRRTNYKPALTGLIQLVALPLTFVAPLDAWTVTEMSPPVIDAVDDLAAEIPAVAAVLDKVCASGPYGALIAAVLPMAMQIAHNHGLIPDAVITTLGGIPRSTLRDYLRTQATTGAPHPAPAAAAA